jgi:hypothetical protein
VEKVNRAADLAGELLTARTVAGPVDGRRTSERITSDRLDRADTAFARQKTPRTCQTFGLEVLKPRRDGHDKAH